MECRWVHEIGGKEEGKKVVTCSVTHLYDLLFIGNTVTGGHILLFDRKTTDEKGNGQGQRG